MSLKKLESMTKEAFNLQGAAQTMGDVSHVIKGVGLGLGALGLAGFALKNIVAKINNDSRRKAIIDDLMLNDPIIKHADKDEVMSYYATMFNVAPTISLDKNIVREMLQNFVRFGKIDIQTVQALAKLELDISNSKGTISDAIKTLPVKL